MEMNKFMIIMLRKREEFTPKAPKKQSAKSLYRNLAEKKENKKDGEGYKQKKGTAKKPKRLLIFQDFINQSQEQALIKEIGNKWSYQLQRPVQHYGWQYDHKL